MASLNSTKMINEYLKYVQVSYDNKGEPYCCGDDLGFMFNFSKDLKIDQGSVIKEVYYLVKSCLYLDLKRIETINFEEIKSETDFISLCCDENKDGTLHFFFDIPMYWYDNLTNNIKQIVLPRGCKISFYKNHNLDDPLSVVLKLYFNLFSNNLVTLESYGTYTPQLYHFQPGAQINRALVKNIVMNIMLEFPKVGLEFYSSIGRLSNFDKYGFTSNTDFVF